ncbi:ff7e848e-065a-48d5-bce0-8fa9aa0ca199 [Thermothielavioides terrestris]|uniref:Ff7e848e-065a-48d5-bce0-8fa9aa0ca199 n=1 Tax=Thermothielavioides terrestris TaxID=2587410 RepID=A0A3S4D5R3_9PEZI|nr:ff7e848e-065a-48d5-bce0-8fa9aa0ca199 [Thermothielavioides terrestris]
MPVKPITPGLTPSLSKYLEQRTQEYRDLSAARSTGRNSYDYPPANWPADRCLLTRLPRELLFLVFDCLYQADLYHLAVTCRYLAALALDLLYSRDISDFDCLALRWACTFDIAPTLERTLSYGAPVDHAFRERSHLGCRWVIDMTAVGATCSTPLTTAIGANGSETIRLLVARGANVNTPDPRTSHVGCGGVHEVLFPIHLAMGTPDGPPSGRFQPGNPTIVRQLLDAGADPNQESVCHYPADPAEMVRHVTPLILAMQPQVPVETVRLLLERGAHPTLPGVYRTSSSFTGIEQLPSEFRARAPLDFMLPPDRFRGHLVFPLDLDKIRILLAYGDVNELCYVQPRLSAWLPDELDDRVPVLYNHWDHRQAADILNLFIAAGVNIADWAEKAHSPILSVIWWAEDEIRLPRRDGALEQRHSIMSRAVEMITLLAEATLVEPSAAGRSLRNSSIIDAVARLDRPETNLWRTGQTPLRYLCSPLRSVDLTELVPLLLRYGADINGADAGPPTDHGLADINSDDAGRRTALHLAVMFGCGAAAHSLLGFLGGPTSSGLTVDARDGHDWTPLHHACLFGFWRDRARQCAAARLLLDHGADVHARTHRGWTPLAFAVLAANPDLVRLLLDHGADRQDLSLSPGGGAGEGETEPISIPRGCVLFRRCGESGDTDRATPLRDMAAEVARVQADIAAMLVDRLGAAAVKPPAESDQQGLLSRFVEWQIHPQVPGHLPIVFCAYLGSVGGTHWTFDRDIEIVFEAMGQLGFGYFAPYEPWEE